MIYSLKKQNGLRRVIILEKLKIFYKDLTFYGIIF